MFLRSYVLRRIARSVRAIERAGAIKEAFAKSFASSQFSTNATDANHNDPEVLKRLDLPESAPCHVIGYQTAPNAPNEVNERDVNGCHEPVVINTDTLVRRGAYKYSDALIDLDLPEPGPFDVCEEDLSHIGPCVQPKYTVASYADDSPVIQEFVKLGVELYKLERDKDLVSYFLTADFERDIKPYIQFLHDCGLPADRLGAFITKNPAIFQQDMDDLHTRIRYLRAHKFSIDMIRKIVYRNPKWLSYKTEFIDKRLGYFQATYKLNGKQVRQLASEAPVIVTQKMSYLREHNFAVKEEMGFNKDETKSLLLKAPRIWYRARFAIVETFDYAHNVMKLSHSSIANQPKLLLCRQKRLKLRHTFLEQLKRAQYDPTKPMYVSPLAVVSGTDAAFCLDVAKCSIETYDLFLKSF